MLETYVCQQLSRYTVEFWKVCDNIRQKLPRTNNGVEGHNYQMSTIFPPYPHILEFFGRLKDEHEYQHHKAEEAQVQKSLKKNI